MLKPAPPEPIWFLNILCFLAGLAACWMTFGLLGFLLMLICPPVMWFSKSVIVRYAFASALAGALLPLIVIGLYYLTGPVDGTGLPRHH